MPYHESPYPLSRGGNRHMPREHASAPKFRQETISSNSSFTDGGAVR